MNFEIVTLGCKVNEYESQYYAQKLEKIGFTQNEGPKDVVIINTCTVTNTAAAKSRKKIHKAKRENPNALIVIVGCYSQSLSEKEREDLQADVIVGANHKKDLPDLILKALKENKPIDTIENIDKLNVFESMPLSLFEHQKRAFLKIQDGCNQFCSYCAIPYVRGRERSMAFDAILENAKELASKGHKEIVLTGIHTGRYHDEDHDLADVLSALLKNTPEDVYYRISSIEITEISDRLIDLIAQNERLLPHLHIPIQAANNETLKRMHRPYTVEEFMERIGEIRKKIPDISISTDVITGFVAESEEEFEDTKVNLEKIGFSFLHVFPYSKRDGTAAAKMKSHLNGTIQKERVRQLVDLSNQLRKKDMERFDEVEVLVERKRNGLYTGYTRQYHPVLIDADVQENMRIKARVKDIADETYRIGREDLL